MFTATLLFYDEMFTVSKAQTKMFVRKKKLWIKLEQCLICEKEEKKNKNK
jgi:hypothetical protein